MGVVMEETVPRRQQVWTAHLRAQESVSGRVNNDTNLLKFPAPNRLESREVLLSSGELRFPLKNPSLDATSHSRIGIRKLKLLAAKLRNSQNARSSRPSLSFKGKVKLVIWIK